MTALSMKRPPAGSRRRRAAALVLAGIAGAVAVALGLRGLHKFSEAFE